LHDSGIHLWRILTHHWTEKSGPHDEVRGRMPTTMCMAFLVMELMDCDLAMLIARMKEIGVSPFSLLVAVDLMLQIAKGMLYLHMMISSLRKHYIQ